jgi:hypothetical protein
MSRWLRQWLSFWLVVNATGKHLEMESEDTQTPFFTTSTALALMIFSIAVYSNGSDANWQTRASTLPHFVHLLADGLEHLPRYWMAIPGLLIAIGASLGASELRSSIHKCAWGAVVASSICTLATFWSFLTTADGMTGGMGSGGAFGVVTLIAVFIAFISVAVSVALITWAPIAITSIAISIIVHAALNVINGLPLPWQAQPGETEVDAMKAAFELASVAAVFGVTASAYGMLPGYAMPRWGTSEPQTFQAIWGKLEEGDPSNPWQSTPQGRKRIATKIERIIELKTIALRDPCDLAAPKSLASAINVYFGNIRVYENWRLGQRLSADSNRVVEMATLALQRKQIGWDALWPHARMHLDAKKYSTVSYEYPLTCP